MAIVFAGVVVGVVAVIATNYDDHTDHSDYDDYDDYAERQEKIRKAKEKEAKEAYARAKKEALDDFNAAIKSNVRLFQTQSGTSFPVPKTDNCKFQTFESDMTPITDCANTAIKEQIAADLANEIIKSQEKIANIDEAIRLIETARANAAKIQCNNNKKENR